MDTALYENVSLPFSWVCVPALCKTKIYFVLTDISEHDLEAQGLDTTVLTDSAYCYRPAPELQGGGTEEGDFSSDRQCILLQTCSRATRWRY